MTKSWTCSEMNLAKTVCALIFILILSASIPSPVFAAFTLGSNPIPVTLGGFSLTPTISEYFFAGSEHRDVTQSYGLKAGYDKIGKSIADSLGIEGTLNYFTTKSKTDTSAATGYLFRLDAIYPFTLGKKWMPFLAVGAGGIVIDSVSHADKSPLLNYGAGLKYFLEDYLAVRVDARHLIVYDNVNTRNNFEVGIGMSYYFGKERKKKPVPPPETKQKEKEDAKDGKKTNGTATKGASGIPALDEIAMAAGGKGDEEKNPAVKGKTPAAPPSPLLVPSIALAPLLALESAAKPLFQAKAPKGSAGEKPVVKAVTPGILPATVAQEKTPPPAGTIHSTVKAEERRPEPAQPLELLPRIEPEAERSEKERLQAEKLARASIKAAIMLQEGAGPVSVGSNGTLPFEITNIGKNSEEFLLIIKAAAEYDAILTRANKPDENITRLQLAPGERFKGAVVFRMPPEIVDGHRSVMTIKVVSTKFSDISFQKETVVISSAPLMRVDAKLDKQKVIPGEKLRYRVTVLNAGSMTAQNLTVRLQLPPQVDFLGTSDVSFKQQPNGTLVFKIDKVDIGKVAEINLDVKVREDSTVGQELRGRVEVVNDSLQKKDIFSATASVIKAK